MGPGRTDGIGGEARRTLLGCTLVAVLVGLVWVGLWPAAVVAQSEPPLEPLASASPEASPEPAVIGISVAPRPADAEASFEVSLARVRADDDGVLGGPDANQPDAIRQTLLGGLPVASFARELEAGVYVAEVDPGVGWRVYDITCTEAGAPAESKPDLRARRGVLIVDAGETASCVFDVVQLGTIDLIIAADSPYADDQVRVSLTSAEHADYLATFGGPQVPGVVLDGPLPANRGTGPLRLPLGDYQLTVSEPDEPALFESLYCEDALGQGHGDPQSQTPGESAVHSITLAGGEDVRCTIHLLTAFDLAVRFSAYPAAPSQSLAVSASAPAEGRRAATVFYGGTWEAGAFLADEDVSLAFGELPDEWEIFTADCDLPGQAGERVECTQELVKKARVRVGLETDDPAAELPFDLSLSLIKPHEQEWVASPYQERQTIQPFEDWAPPDVTPATYRLALETEPSPLWKLGSAECSVDTSGADGSLELPLDPGEVANCTYHIDTQGTLTIGLESDPPDAGATFDFLVTESGSDRMAASGGLAAPGTWTLTPEPAGTYVVTPVRPDGSEEWSVRQTSCEDSEPGIPTVIRDDGTAVVGLDAGAHVTCTFAVARTGLITLVAFDDSPDADAVLDLRLTGSDGSLVTAGPLTSSGFPGGVTFAGIDRGRYSLTLDRGSPGKPWTILDLTCQETAGPDISGDRATTADPSGEASIGVDANETVTCTYSLTDWTVPQRGRWSANNTKSRLVGCEPVGRHVIGADKKGSVNVRPRLTLDTKVMRLSGADYDSAGKDRYTNNGGGWTRVLTVTSPTQMTLVQTSDKGGRGKASVAPPGCQVERTYKLTAR